jgi:hypothetical protein
VTAAGADKLLNGTVVDNGPGAGSGVSYGDSRAAFTTFTVQRRGPRGKWVTLGIFGHQDRAGVNRVHWGGASARAGWGPATIACWLRRGRRPRPGRRPVPASRSPRLAGLASPSDTKSLIETAVTRFLAEVPALANLKLVVGLELRGRGDVQIYRVEVPGPKISKDVPADAKVTLSVSRSHFNELATKGRVRDWREAFQHGDAKATGIEQVMKLIVNVVERQEERARLRKAHH